MSSLFGASTARFMFDTVVRTAFPTGSVDRSPIVEFPDGTKPAAAYAAGSVEAVTAQLDYMERQQDSRIFTADFVKILPPLYASENKNDPLVVAKFFNPAFGWTWYVFEGSFTDSDGIMIEEGESEGDPEDFTFFGYVDSDFSEMGYFTLKQFRDIEQATHLCMERDLYFSPIPFSELQAKLQAKRH